MGTLKNKWGPNGDPKSEKGPHGDPGPQMGTHVGAVLVLLVLVLLDILQFVVTFTVGHITVVCGYSWQKLQLSEVTVV